MYYIKLGNMFVQNFYFEDETEEYISDVECTNYSQVCLLFDSERYANHIASLIGGTVHKR